MSPSIAAAKIAIAKAKQTRIAAVGVYNSYFSGRNAYYLERIVNAGLVGLHTASGAPHIVPPSATRPALGTNPIAFGFPSADGPVIFDIGTASLMWGEVLLAAETGEALPPGAAFYADGNPTVDGRAVAQGGVAAFGGHKGYGLAFAIQALGILAGVAIPRGQVRDYGFLFLVLDPGALLPGKLFAAFVVMAKQRVAGRSRHGFVYHASAPVIGLVPGQKEPRPCLHCIGIGNRCPKQIFDRSYLQRHRSGLYRVPMQSTTASMGGQSRQLCAVLTLSPNYRVRPYASSWWPSALPD